MHDLCAADVVMMMMMMMILIMMCWHVQASPLALAKQVLAEVPDQVCRYFQLNNIPPGVRAAAPSAAATVPAQHGGPVAPQGQGVYPQMGQVQQ